MKKIYIIILVVLSLFLINRTYYEENQIEATKVYNLNSTLEEEMNLSENYLMIEIDENDYQDIINDIVAYADKYQTKMSTNIAYEDEEGINTYINYFIANIDQLPESIHIDIQNQSKSYYTTDLKDNHSKGYIKIINNNFFEDTHDIIRIYQLSDIKELDYKTSKIGISIFSNQEQDIRDFKDFLTKNHPIRQIFDTEGNEINYPDSSSIIDSYSVTYLSLCIILLLSLLICIIIKEHKKYLISRMLGNSILKLVFRNFMPFFVISIIVFCLSNMIGCYLKIGEINELTKEYYYSYQIVNIYYIVIIAIIFLFIYIFIKYSTHIKYLKLSQPYGHFVIIQWIVKAIVIVLLITPVISTFSESFPYIKQYISIQKQKETIENYYQISGSFVDNQKVFDYYNNKEIYCNMDKYYMRSKDSPFYDPGDEYAIYYDYEYLEANPYYLQNNVFYDEQGKQLNLSHYSENILLIPYQIKNKIDMEIYNPQGYDVIYVKQTGYFFNFKIRNIFEMNNPIICVINNYNDSIDMQGFLLDKRHKSYNEFVYEIEEMQDQNMQTARLTSCINAYDFYIDRCQEYIPEFIITVIIFLLIVLCNVYITTRMYLEEFGKEIAIQYMLGKTKKERYSMIFIFILSSTIIASTVSYLIFNLVFIQFIKFIALLVCIEFFVILMIVYSFEKKGLISYLKSGTM